MSHYPTDSMGFFDTIQIYFMELTGRAIMFSGRDLELLSRWRAEGASAAVVCRGLRDAVEAMGEKELPRDIYNCRKYIEPQVQMAREKAVGGHDASDSGAEADAEEGVFAGVLRNLVEAGRRAEGESIKELYRDAYRRVRALKEASAEAFDELARVERALVDGFFERLEAGERARIEARIVQESRPLLEQMSAEARAEHLRARRRLLLIREYGLARLE